MPDIETYQEIEKYLFGLEGRGWKLDLDRIQKFLAYLDDPHQKFYSIHIAGTNGKGSVAAMAESILRKAGYKTGLYTSPHLIETSERILVSGNKIPKNILLNYTQQFKAIIDELNCTFFETITAFAFLFFAETKIDIAVVEVGLGGRFDATNVLMPLVSVITDIALDHTQHLGNNLSQIASEKAGIIKPNVPCVIKSTDSDIVNTIKYIAKKRNAELIHYNEDIMVDSVAESINGTTFNLFMNKSVVQNVKISLIGEHQIGNAVTAIKAVSILRTLGWNISNDDIVKGLENTSWPGRCQIIRKNPTILVDVAHNPAAIAVLCKAVTKHFQKKSKIVILGVMTDKDYQAMIRILASVFSCLIAVQPKQKRALHYSKLMDTGRLFFQKVFGFEEVEKGVEYAGGISIEDSLICITGSHYTVGEALAKNILTN